MAQINFNRTLRLTFQYSITGNRLSCNMNYGLSADITALSAENLVDQWVAEVWPLWQDVISEEVKAQRVIAYSNVPNLCLPGEKYFTSVNGQVSGDALPSNIAAIVQLRQQDVPSEANGRFYISGLSEASIENSLITGAFISTEIQALLDGLAEPLDLGGGVTAGLVCVQRSFNGSPVGPFAWSVAQIFAQRALGTQRRRTTEWRTSWS